MNEMISLKENSTRILYRMYDKEIVLKDYSIFNILTKKRDRYFNDNSQVLFINFCTHTTIAGKIINLLLLRTYTQVTALRHIFC